MSAFRSLVLGLVLLSATPVFAADKPAKPQGKMVFVANTGLEDVQTLSSSLRHATEAKKSGHLSDVVWLVYGRAILALDPTVSAVPASVRDAAKGAKAAGVRIVACAHALKKYDIDPKTLVPETQVVDNAVHELARFVAEGYQVIRY